MDVMSSKDCSFIRASGILRWPNCPCTEGWRFLVCGVCEEWICGLRPSAAGGEVYRRSERTTKVVRGGRGYVSCGVPFVTSSLFCGESLAEGTERRQYHFKRRRPE